MMEEFTREKINGETAKTNWHELQTFFASGNVVAVAAGVDLVEVAYQMSKNNDEQMKQWMEQEQVGLVSDTTAAAWFENNQELWTVVVRPFVLVQAV